MTRCTQPRRIASKLLWHTDNERLAQAMRLTLGSAKVLLRSVYAKTGSADKAQLLLICLRVLHPERP